MEGITILNTIENQIQRFQFNGICLSITLVGITVILFFIYVVVGMKEEAGVIPAFVSAFITFAFVFSAGQTVIDTYQTYEVIIDDSVLFEDFSKRYEVIEQRGQIYEIKEKGEQ